MHADCLILLLLRCTNCRVDSQELAYTIQQLESQEAPGPALAAVQGLLGQLVAAGVQQLAGHLHAVPGWLIAREGWQLSVTHSGSQPITMMPEQLQVGLGLFAGCCRQRFVVACHVAPMAAEYDTAARSPSL
jgi:hypothetical protein